MDTYLPGYVADAIWQARVRLRQFDPSRGDLAELSPWSSGPADPRPSQDGSPFKFCSPLEVPWISVAEYLDGNMSRISPKCSCRFHWSRRGALGCPGSAERA